jgi:hypothetical protein
MTRNYSAEVASYVLSLVRLVSLIYDKNIYDYLPQLEDLTGENVEEIFGRNLEVLYNGEGLIWTVVKEYIKRFILLFGNAVAKEPEYANPSYRQVFSFNFPKLSALYSLSLYVYMTGGLAYTDASQVRHRISQSSCVDFFLFFLFLFVSRSFLCALFCHSH